MVRVSNKKGYTSMTESTKKNKISRLPDEGLGHISSRHNIHDSQIKKLIQKSNLDPYEDFPANTTLEEMQKLIKHGYKNSCQEEQDQKKK